MRTGWQYDLLDWPLDSQQSHEDWLDHLRAEGWKLWQPRQTWEGSQIELDGRQVIRHSLRRWTGPGPEPELSRAPGEWPADT